MPLCPARPQLAEFVARLDAINALAEASLGFVWRLAGAGGNATDIKVEDPTILVNMSVWASPEALFEFVYKTAHVEVMARRREWFERMALYQVLWWIPAGTVPTVDEALARLAHLDQHGPTPEAFTFKRRFGFGGGIAGIQSRQDRDPLLPSHGHSRSGGIWIQHPSAG